MNLDQEQPMGPRVRPRRGDVRARILVAATEAFEYHGYSNATVQMVAQRAGFTKGAVYSNFSGKPALFAAAALAKLAAESLPAVEAALPASGTGADADAEAIRVMGKIAANAVLNGPQRWYILLNEFRVAGIGDAASRDAYAVIQNQRVEALYDLMAQLPFARQFPPARLRRILRVTVGLLDSIVMERATQPDVLNGPTIEALTVACLTHLVESASAGQRNG